MEYLQLVGIIFGLGLKVYFTNLVAMYRMYDISNKVTWLEPLANALMFMACNFGLGMDALSSLFYGLTLSSLGIALYMYLYRHPTARQGGARPGDAQLCEEELYRVPRGGGQYPDDLHHSAAHHTPLQHRRAGGFPGGGAPHLHLYDAAVCLPHLPLRAARAGGQSAQR
ncbi:hypothetical protein AERO9A_140374 [Aeromonas salmonicida]|nr:hypothetical protein AERO9A_140374 [Aeromonas salmonicida]